MERSSQIERNKIIALLEKNQKIESLSHAINSLKYTKSTPHDHGTVYYENLLLDIASELKFCIDNLIQSGIPFTNQEMKQSAKKLATLRPKPENLFCSSRLRYPHEVIFLCIGWYINSSISTRSLEILMKERGVSVDHTSIDGWRKKFYNDVEFATRCVFPNSDDLILQACHVRIKGRAHLMYTATTIGGQIIDLLATDEKYPSQSSTQKLLDFIEKGNPYSLGPFTSGK